MSEHLSNRQIEGYRRRTLEPAELLALDDHLAQCAACRRQMREATEPRPALLALQSNLRDAAAQPGLWRKITDLLSPTALRLAGVAALLVLAVILALRYGMSKRDDLVITPSPLPASPTPQASVNPSPDTLLALSDGGRQVTLDVQGKLTGFDTLSSTDRQRVVQALQTQRVETSPELAKLRSSSGTLMGQGGETGFALLDPIGKIILSAYPTLRWKPLSGAASYTVTITDPGSNYEEVAVSPALNEAQWTVDRALKRGRVYAWLVTATKDDRKITSPSAEAGEAKFKVLEQSKADEISRARKSHAGSHLVLGLLYAQAGLLDEAEREFKTLAADNPESPVVKSLLRDLQTRRSAR